MSSITNPVGPGFCGMPKYISNNKTNGIDPNDPVILGFMPMVFNATSDGLNDGDTLLCTLEHDCEFGKAGEYPSMPFDGNIYSGFVGNALADNDDVAQLGLSIGIYQKGGIAAININIGLTQNITGSTFLGTLRVDTVLVDDKHFTVRVRTEEGVNISRPFRIHLMDLGMMRKIAITKKP